jgi:hypothetical protein
VPEQRTPEVDALIEASLRLLDVVMNWCEAIEKRGPERLHWEEHYREARHNGRPYGPARVSATCQLRKALEALDGPPGEEQEAPPV